MGKVRFRLADEVFVLSKLNKHLQRFINYLLFATENEMYIFIRDTCAP